MSTALQTAIAEFRLQETALNRVVDWVCTHGGPTRFPRIIDYLTKENGGLGWEDTYQNIFIDRLAASSWVKTDTDGNILCAPDQSRWHRESYEWRMGAIKERLVIVGSDDPKTYLPVGAPCLDTGCVFFSPDFFRTAGVEPDGLTRVDLPYVVHFLTELTDGTYIELQEPNISHLNKKMMASRSWWRRLLRING